jgi:hypothetical protein
MSICGLKCLLICCGHIFFIFWSTKVGKLYFSSVNLTNYAKILETLAKDLVSQNWKIILHVLQLFCYIYIHLNFTLRTKTLPMYTSQFSEVNYFPQNSSFTFFASFEWYWNVELYISIQSTSMHIIQSNLQPEHISSNVHKCAYIWLLIFCSFWSAISVIITFFCGHKHVLIALQERQAYWILSWSRMMVGPCWVVPYLPRFPYSKSDIWVSGAIGS